MLQSALLTEKGRRVSPAAFFIQNQRRSQRSAAGSPLTAWLGVSQCLPLSQPLQSACSRATENLSSASTACHGTDLDGSANSSSVNSSALCAKAQSAPLLPLCDRMPPPEQGLVLFISAFKLCYAGKTASDAVFDKIRQMHDSVLLYCSRSNI